MCGIVGAYAYGNTAPDIETEELTLIRDRMIDRGPDGYGIWMSDTRRVGFAHRRLSIIDLSERSLQPMRSHDGGIVITFNGEIYNYKELRSRLIQRGCKFTSEGDTEVLLHLYREFGLDMMSELRGMFAFALWDSARCELVLVRDPYGIKPLYYVNDGATVRFASQVKPLTTSSNVSRASDPAGLLGFLLFGSVPEPFTLYRAIHSVPAGSFVVIGPKGVKQARCYTSISQILARAKADLPGTNAKDVQDLIRESLLDSVRHHLVSDVPVGAFLSGGLDSGSLLGMMRELTSGEIRTVTLRFAEFEGSPDDESQLATEVAKLYGARHTTRLVTRSEFEGDLSKIIEAMDQPSVDGVNTYYASKAAREIGLKVVISGLGGDELFGSYPSFSQIPRWVNAFHWSTAFPRIGSTLRALMVGTGLRFPSLSAKAASFVEYAGTFSGAYLLRRGLFMPWEIRQLLDPETFREGMERLQPLQLLSDSLVPDPGNDYSRVVALESSIYLRNQLLRDSDWASMAHSLELRLPLVDAKLLSEIAPSMQSFQSAHVKRLLARVPRPPLPESIQSRKKIGFLIPFAPWIEDENHDTSFERHGIRLNHWSRRWALTVAKRFGLSRRGGEKYLQWSAAA